MLTFVREELQENLEFLMGDIYMARSVAKDKRRWAASLEKRCQLTEGLRLNLKYMDESEGEIVRKLASGR